MEINERQVSRRKPGPKPKPLPAAERLRKNLETQRAFRQRKADKIAQLEARVAQLQTIVDAKQPDSNSSECDALRQRLLAAECENSILRQSGIAVDFKASFPTAAAASILQTCNLCKVEKARTLIALGQLQLLTNQVAELQQENETLKAMFGLDLSMPVNDLSLVGFRIDNSTPFSAFFASAGNFGLNMTTGIMPSSSQASNPISLTNTPINTVGKTTVEIYGAPEIQFAIIGIKSINSLKNCIYVDLYFDSFNAILTTVADKTTYKQFKLKALKLRAMILKACDTASKKKVLEMLWMIHKRNPDHFNHIRKLYGSAFEAQEEVDPIPSASVVNLEDVDPEQQTRISAVRQALLSIPSLRNEAESIETLCFFLFVNSYSPETQFTKITSIKHQLYAKCRENMEDSVN
ncbi:hypothetical protein HK100_008239, partial [Physocladia obscura]